MSWWTCAIGLVAALGCTPRDFARREPLWPGEAPGARGTAKADRPELFYYLPPAGKANGAAAIVAPGGSYAHTGGLRPEAFPTARWLAEQGFVAVVLRYRVSGDGYAHRDFLADGRRAVQRVRAQAAELGVDPQKVGFIGYSAGGHLAGFVATACGEQGDAAAADPLEQVSCRPDFIVMVYPVVTLDDRWAHQRSKRSLLGEEAATPQLEKELSLEQRVTASAPPAMLVHSRKDAKVVFHNSELYDEAARARGAPSRLQLYDDGRHGVGLAQRPGMPQMASWPATMLAWLRELGVVAK
ncbi:alpha/beta hydrolase [Nannocystis pusilla]|uniref:Alpha/beta hydrolase n=1 Tax=Nannocystis pusilla TaxID=889268 RepID=A0ABS7TSP0_9BACT|nr:alpha/beta hydrolase [Nannocystis pusilla]MBZ5711167.1 alpha/beta hydrolase [Nannocystis pusilla]